MATSVITAGNKKEHRTGTGILVGVVVALAAFVGFLTLRDDAHIITPEVITPIESSATTGNAHLYELERQFGDRYTADVQTFQEAIDAAAAEAWSEHGLEVLG